MAPSSSAARSWLALDELVKHGSYPHWPAYISFEETDDGREWMQGGGRGEEAHYWCVFLNDYTGAWV